MNTINTQLQQAKHIYHEVPNNKLESLYDRAQRLLASPINSLQIAKVTGVNHASVMRLRRPYGNQCRKLSKMSFGTMLCLADYQQNRPQTNLRNGKLRRQYFIGLACINLDIDPTEYKAIAMEVVSNARTVSELSRRIHISRSHLTQLRDGKLDILNQTMGILVKITDYYYNKVQDKVTA